MRGLDWENRVSAAVDVWVVSHHTCCLACAQDYERGSLYGLEKFWAFHHYAGLPKDQAIEIQPKVRGGRELGAGGNWGKAATCRG